MNIISRDHDLQTSLWAAGCEGGNEDERLGSAGCLRPCGLGRKGREAQGKPMLPLINQCCKSTRNAFIHLPV